MSLEDRPEEVGNREHNADKGNIRQEAAHCCCQSLGASIAAARTALRFAGVIEDLLLRGGGINFPAQGRRAALADFAEVTRNSVPFGGFVPLVPGHFKNLANFAAQIYEILRSSQEFFLVVNA